MIHGLYLEIVGTRLATTRVDELKILSEEELVDIAFQASLKGGNLTGDRSLSSEDCSNGTRNDSRNLDVDLSCSIKSRRDEDYEPSNYFPKRSKTTSDDGKMNGDISNMRKRATQNDTTHEVNAWKKKLTDTKHVLSFSFLFNTLTLLQMLTWPNENYMAEVEKLARIKEKQEEDKSAARLHSFSGACGPVTCVTPSSEKKERMSSFNSTSYSTKVKPSSNRENIPLHSSEILLCIEVYHSRKAWVKTQEILVLGQQLLTELRDKIYCLTDEIMKLSNKNDPSGYFLIEDIFYNDLREADAIDYSKPILDWLKVSEKTALEKWECIISGELQQKQKELLGSGNGPKLPRLKALPMQATRFCDLSFRLGAGYLYCHQGDCKHVMVIRDMRLIHPQDVQNRAAYPLIMFQSKVRFQKCSSCKIYKAVKVTVDDKWAPENPCYFCGICYYMLHYSNNQLIYNNFKVFDYIHD
ncbi:hypothetical protein Ccrd_021648 [Cynara cardunculus var. scolymus]|uniref:snRNA-activating protein complex, subunit 3 n=1 Tax=Cynara cardunculus var. scolymus TaxID=59895 RepID=A0A103Y074_CYNCS|nr:hypothetical protein Ccrd_021648 [Cynara cardunculus var. scolymus]